MTQHKTALEISVIVLLVIQLFKKKLSNVFSKIDVYKHLTLNLPFSFSNRRFFT